MPLADAPAMPRDTADWEEWVTYGLLWARRSPVELTTASPAGPATTSPPTSPPPTPRSLTMHAYREARPGPRWRALFDATWPAYRAWYLSEGEAARPSLAECREAIATHLPGLLGTWERLGELAGDELAARMLSMWRAPAFAVNCSQAVIPGERPVVVRNYDYDPALFEGVIASTDYSGGRTVLGTSDMLWGLLDGMNPTLAVSLTYGGRGSVGPGFAIPIVIRYLLETCGTVAAAIEALRRIPVSQSYNIALADTTGDHATVYVAPGADAVVSRLQATTNHFLDVVERPEHAARFRSVERFDALTQMRADDANEGDLVAAMLATPMRAEEFDAGFGTLYTVSYAPSPDPALARATWHWPGQHWT
ncbi:MAG: C45 family peptidase, partial [Nocardioides sp.]